jgi:hypothetical protein
MGLSMSKTPQELADTMLANLPEKTGKTLDQWLALVKAQGASKHGAIVAWLKAEHGVTHGFANLVAHKALQGDDRPGDEDLLATQYAGAKADLKPIYDALIAAVESLSGVEVAPKKTYVSLRRSKQFAIIQPSTRTRVDLGLNLKGDAVCERLEAAGSFNAMVSHRVRLTTPDAVDQQVRNWLKKAWSVA